MARVIVPDATCALRLVEIERAAFEDREILWTFDDFVGVGGPPDAAAITDDEIREGFLIMRMAADEAEILNFGVVPWARRKGRGRELLDAAQLLAQGLGIRSLFLEVAVDNTAAIALYTGNGFLEVGERPKYYLRPDGSRTNALVLRKAL